MLLIDHLSYHLTLFSHPEYAENPFKRVGKTGKLKYDEKED